MNKLFLITCLAWSFSGPIYSSLNELEKGYYEFVQEIDESFAPEEICNCDLDRKEINVLVNRSESDDLKLFYKNLNIQRLFIKKYESVKAYHDDSFFGCQPIKTLTLDCLNNLTLVKKFNEIYQKYANEFEEYTNI